MIEYHADDYGLFPRQSRRILDCCENGALNGISIMPNSPFLAECMEMLEPYRDRLKMTIHLNFVEGVPLSPPNEVSLLINESGAFDISFFKLLVDFRHSKAYRTQLKEEITRQLYAVKPYYRGAPLRIDGHVHYQMLPVVFDALMEVVQKEMLDVSYIRFPEEDWKRYFACKKETERVKPINFVKVVILNALAIRNRKKYRDYLSKLEQKKFIGVAFSGCMKYQNVKPLIDQLSPEENIEVLFHPGGVTELEDIAQLTSKDDLAFLTSANRSIEAETLCQLM